MRLRRCHTVFIEARERRGLELTTVLVGEARLSSSLEWVALTAHQDAEVVLDLAALALLGQVSPSQWVERAALAADHAAATIDALIAAGLLVVEDTPAGADPQPAGGHWHGLAAVAHRHLRWHGVDSQQVRAGLPEHLADRSVLDRLGPPPPTTRARAADGDRLPLSRAGTSALDSLLERRATCRNFDAGRALSEQTLATMLYRVYGARAVGAVSGLPMLKKSAPSAGGLHPVEAYLLVRRVEGVATGLYHYHPIDHALEPIKALADAQAAQLARVFVAHQNWFVDAPVQVILAGRFQRNFWKYRQHAKAYRAVVLDAGHLSQTQYLAATELGLAAFITAAVNEGDIEDAFGLDPMTEGVLAVTGFGYRGPSMTELEFDPQHAIWPATAGADRVGE